MCHMDVREFLLMGQSLQNITGIHDLHGKLNIKTLRQTSIWLQKLNPWLLSLFIFHFFFFLRCRRLRAAFLNQVIRNRLCLSEQTYPGLLESGPDPRYVVIRLHAAIFKSLKTVTAPITLSNLNWRALRSHNHEDGEAAGHVRWRQMTTSHRMNMFTEVPEWRHHYLVYCSIYFHRNDEICVVHRL